ncbi:hypothetical protein MHK_010814, partial [Candidatus Magnetomorum sp. HK-1]
SFCAYSHDGIHFKSYKEDIGPYYFRLFYHNNYYYAFAKHKHECGLLLRSSYFNTQFITGPKFINKIRHTAVLKIKNDLHLFYTKIGDKPESIRYTKIKINDSWEKWNICEGTVVLKPDFEYEGSNLPIEESKPGMVKHKVNQIRDPCIYKEGKKIFLLYCIAGEKGIAIAEILSSLS